jgi:hypothetical protein
MRQTSLEAKESIRPMVNRLAAIVLEIIESSRTLGKTCDEIEEVSKLKHQTVSARVRELFQKGLIEDSGGRRATRSGRRAIVWVVK